MTTYEITFRDDDIFYANDLSDYHIKNLLGCDCVKSVKEVTKND